MLQAGDEIGRTQQGNNNAYCQDNEISWLDWNLDDERRKLLEFTRRLIRFFHQHPVLRRRKFFQGHPLRGSEAKDVTWYRLDGQEMTEADWLNESARTLTVRLAGDQIDEVDERGHRVVDDTLLILFNAYHEPLPFTLPKQGAKIEWELLIDTRDWRVGGRRKPVRGGGRYEVEARSLAVFCLKQKENGRRGATV